MTPREMFTKIPIVEHPVTTILNSLDVNMRGQKEIGGV